MTTSSTYARFKDHFPQVKLYRKPKKQYKDNTSEFGEHYSSFLLKEKKEKKTGCAAVD